MNEKLLALLILLRIAMPFLIGIPLLAYLIILTVEVLHASHTLKTLLPLIEAHKQEIEDALKEFQQTK